MSVNTLYDDAVLNYLGRWTDSGSDMWAGWQGAQIRFKVSGSLTLDINVNVQDLDTINTTVVNVSIDGGNFTTVFTTTFPEIFTGSRTANYVLPDTGEHEIIVKVACLPNQQWDSTGKCRITSIDTDNGSTISAWEKTTGILVGEVGDSWMGVSNDWPYLLDQSKYWIYQVGSGGYRASTIDARIDYDSDGVLNTDDPIMPLIIVNSSVNDYNAGVTLASFNTSFASVVDKLRAQHPDALIVLLQSPRNTTDGRNYDQYGSEMSTIAGARSRVEYISITATEWNTYTWADPAHLDFVSRQAFASYIESQLDALNLFNKQSKGYIIE